MLVYAVTLFPSRTNRIQVGFVCAPGASFNSEPVASPGVRWFDRNCVSAAVPLRPHVVYREMVTNVLSSVPRYRPPEVINVPPEFSVGGVTETTFTRAS